MVMQFICVSVARNCVPLARFSFVRLGIQSDGHCPLLAGRPGVARRRNGTDERSHRWHRRHFDFRDCHLARYLQ